MNRVKRIVMLFVLILLSLLVISCGGEGIPTIDEARYEIRSKQAGTELCIFADEYKVIDGVLYLDTYWTYEQGWVWNPTYTINEGPLILTDWGLKVRK